MKSSATKIFAAALLAVFGWANLEAGEIREWTSKDGRKLKAEFISATDRHVTVRRASDGRRFTLELDKISEGDRDWVIQAVADLAGPGEKEPGGIFEGRTTDDWEKMEFESLKFRFYGSEKLRSKERYPLVIFLHGKGSGGRDNEKQLNGAARKFAQEEIYKDNPSFILVPQCPDDSVGWNGEYLNDVIGLIKVAIENLPVDENRVYITGISMGGFGTWAAIAADPELFAAAVPVCGGGNPRSASAIKGIPIWTHHGVADDIVSVEFTRRMVEALERVKGDIKYTEYDKASGIKHNAWTPCYGNPEVFEWMFAQRRGAKK